MTDSVRALIVAFAANPAAVGAAYGKRTGQCCFCCRHLETRESVAVGYGPICAEKFGLPWGEVGEAEIVAPAASQPVRYVLPSFVAARLHRGEALRHTGRCTPASRPTGSGSCPSRQVGNWGLDRSPSRPHIAGVASSAAPTSRRGTGNHRSRSTEVIRVRFPAE